MARPYKIFLVSMMISPLAVSASKIDVEAEYARACKLTVGFEVPAIVANWKDEGVSKSEALESYKSFSDPELTDRERSLTLEKINLIYGRYRDLSSEEIYVILVNECVEKAVASGGLT